jgi:hypothetical protein
MCCHLLYAGRIDTRRTEVQVIIDGKGTGQRAFAVRRLNKRRGAPTMTAWRVVGGLRALDDNRTEVRASVQPGLQFYLAAGFVVFFLVLGVFGPRTAGFRIVGPFFFLYFLLPAVIALSMAWELSGAYRVMGRLRR